MNSRILVVIIGLACRLAPASDKVISVNEVAQHSTPKDCWTYVKDSVYDITRLIPVHAEEASDMPSDHMHQFCGKDSTEGWKWQGDKGISHKKKSEIKLKKYKIGVLIKD